MLKANDPCIFMHEPWFTWYAYLSGKNFEWVSHKDWALQLYISGNP